MGKLPKYSGKEYRRIGGRKYQFRFAFKLKGDADRKAKALRREGRMVRVIAFEGGYGLFMVKK